MFISQVFWNECIPSRWTIEVVVLVNVCEFLLFRAQVAYRVEVFVLFDSLPRPAEVTLVAARGVLVSAIETNHPCHCTTSVRTTGV